MYAMCYTFKCINQEEYINIIYLFSEFKTEHIKSVVKKSEIQEKRPQADFTVEKKKTVGR